MAVDIASLVQSNNILLFAFLVFVFVMAYKVLQTLIQTAIVSVLSIVFLFTINYLGIAINVNLSNILLFAALGPLLYLGYTLLFQTTAFVTKLAGIAGKVVGAIGGFFKKLSGALFGWLRSPVKKDKKGGSAKKESSARGKNSDNDSDDDLKLDFDTEGTTAQKKETPAPKKEKKPDPETIIKDDEDEPKEKSVILHELGED